MRARIVTYKILILMTGWVSVACAQQVPVTNWYTLNVFSVNSAYAGFNNCTEAYIDHAERWVGIEGAPSTNYLGAHTAISPRFGVGASFLMDQTHLIDRFSGAVALSYQFDLGDEHRIRFGSSLGYYRMTIDVSNTTVDDPSDDLLSAGNLNGSTLDMEVSLYYELKRLQLGISVPQILESNADFDLDNYEAGFQLVRHANALAMYNLDLNDKWTLQPALAYRVMKSNLNQFDALLGVSYNGLIEIAGGYRTEGIFLARTNFYIGNKVVVGYAYEIPGSELSAYSGGSHEFIVGLKFCKANTPKQAVEEQVDVTAQEPPVEPIPETPEEIEVPEPEETEIQQEEPLPPEPTVEELVVAPTVVPVPKQEEQPALQDTVPVETVPKIVVVEPDQDQEPEIVPQAISEKEPIIESSDFEIYFEKDSTRIAPAYTIQLNELARELRGHEAWKLIITGHSCDLGSEEVKEWIAKARGWSVRYYLVQQGVERRRITVVGKSDRDPKAPGRSEKARQLNRQVEIEVVKDDD